MDTGLKQRLLCYFWIIRILLSCPFSLHCVEPRLVELLDSVTYLITPVEFDPNVYEEKLFVATIGGAETGRDNCRRTVMQP